MSDKDGTVFGVLPDEWQSAYRLGINEFSASKFIVKSDGEIIRIAFGNSGPPLNEQGLNGCPTYTHAVTLTSAMAVELSRVLRDVIAGPAKKSAE